MLLERDLERGVIARLLADVRSGGSWGLERLIAESQGNPLALLELPRCFTPAELAGGFELFSAVAVPRRIEETFRRQVTSFSPMPRQVLLVAAAEPLGDPVLLWRAVARLGLDHPTAAPSSTEAAGLVEFASRVRFPDPLLRSVIYKAASPDQRRRAPWALVQVTDPWPTGTGARGTSPGPPPSRTRTSPPSWSIAPRGPGASRRRPPSWSGPLNSLRTRCAAGDGSLPPRRPRTWRACPTPRRACWRWPRPARRASSTALARTCCTPLANRDVQVARDRRSRPGRCRGVRPGRPRPGDPPPRRRPLPARERWRSGGRTRAGFPGPPPGSPSRSTHPRPAHEPCVRRRIGGRHDRDFRRPQADR
jgi:hypothetical protein